MKRAPRRVVLLWRACFRRAGLEGGGGGGGGGADVDVDVDGGAWWREAVVRCGGRRREGLFGRSVS